MGDDGSIWIVRRLSTPPGKLEFIGAVLLIGAAASSLAESASILWIDGRLASLVWIAALVLGGVASLLRLPRCGLRVDDDGVVVARPWRTVRMPWSNVRSASLRPTRPVPGGYEIELVTTSGDRIRTGVVEGGDAARVRSVVAAINERRLPRAVGAP